MVNSRIARVAFAVALSWGVWAGLARAGGSDLYPRTPPAATELPPGHPPVDSSPSKTPFKDWVLYKRPLGCWGSFNGYGCQSGRATLAFMFGGCRTFFGQSCLKGAPPSALPPWTGPESGYWNPPPGSPAWQAQQPGSPVMQTQYKGRPGCNDCQ